ncbi:DUF1542 domain-containing protein, partial [Lactobacillus gallinarum]|uniref:DUF1542 domain-containing protein n=1 Tax=Lactobacillus gallinarum TaxID=52242 RepID=UPI00389104A1
MKQLKFLETKRTPRYSLRKFSVGMVSVLLGVTIFGINFTNHSVKAATTNGNSQQTSAVVLTTAERTNTQKATSATEEVQQNSVSNDVTEKVQQNVASNDATANNSTEAATTLQSAPKTQGSAGSGASGSSATGVASGSQASNSQAARTTSSAATASQAVPETQVTAPAASQSSAPANSGNATSSPASQEGTTSANHTASNTNTTPSSQTVSVNETTFPAAQSRILMTKFLAAQSQNLMTNLTADYLPKSAQNSETDTTLPTTTQTYDKVEQPLLYDYGLHVDVKGNRDGKTWVNKNLYWYRDSTLDTIFGENSKPGIITSHPDKYFFAAYVDYSEKRYHRVILLARGQDPSDKNLYSYTIHTASKNTSTTTTKPGESIKEQYTGIGGSTYDLIFKNYGDSFTVKLNGFEGGLGLLPVFDGGLLDPTYGSNTYDQNHAAAQAKSIGFWASALPQKTSTKVRYVDQATGKDIVQPMEISGFGYQGFKVKGEAPTVKGYKLVSSPKFLPSTNKASAYEDGTISPYEVGQTYDLALSDSVVIKQTVIHTDGTVRATVYYKGSPLKNASKVLGRESGNDKMSFGTPDGKYYTYTNRIGQVDDSYIYYYAKDSDPKGSEMRLHFIDVTGVNNSSYAPSDGPELVDKVQTIHGNIGDKYGFTYTVPTNYYEVGSSDVTGTYSGTHHDAYIYVKIDRNGAKATIENLTHLNHAQKQAAEAAIDQATDLNTMNQATSTATTLDGDMGKLSDLTADLTNTNNYKYASDKPKSTVATDYTNANVLLDKDDKTAGQNADDATVLKLIDQINTHKSSLDGDTNLSDAETTISGLTHLNDAQRSAANQAVTNASDLTGLKTAVGNAQSVDSAMSDLQTAVNQANEAKTTNNYLQASADKQANLNSAVQNAQDVLAATGANDSANQVKDLTKSVNDAVDALDGDANTNATKDAAKNAIDQAAKTKNDAIDGSNLTDEEKAGLHQQVSDEVNKAKAAIDDAKKDADVTTAKNTGVEKINNINVPDTSATKEAAKAAIDQALNTKTSEINGATNLDQPTKDKLIQDATDAATKAKDAIDKATTNNDVATEQTKGTKAIDAVKVPSLTDSQTAAKKAIDDALNTKTSEINGATNLDQP